eukprot:TRINITY_DN23057_c0_g1_i1.p1 TRINITY_DN23057_c0_g1~~TRINITY_DN23057_c0_g1_i1.p1  ORF type:complete len:549 (-),score=78.90 TRINITY_DN23057_c0_g1_i1:67-1635(-)
MEAHQMLVVAFLFLQSCFSIDFVAARESPVVESGCTVAVIGAGWSGVYWAWRLGVDAAFVPSGQICVFEAYARVGGRTYTVSEPTSAGGTTAVELGAYRFAGDMHLPADLIMRALKLDTTCYDPFCRDEEEIPNWPYKEPLRKVVDKSGLNKGYVTPINVMLEQFEAAGGRLFRGHRLDGIKMEAATDPLPSSASLPTSGRNMSLRFQNGRAVHARLVLLNLPRSVLLRIKGLDTAMSDRTRKIFACDSVTLPILPPPLLHSSASNSSGGVKAYAYYADAWWISKLNLTRGKYRDETQDPPLAIRYHDGPVECKEGVDAVDETIWGPPIAGGVCRGALQVVYDFNNVDWWLEHQGNRGEPATRITEPEILTKVHSRLLDAHASVFARAGVNPKSLPLPEWIALGTWVKDPSVLQPGPAKVVYKGEDAGLAKACKVQNLTGIEYAESILKPVWPDIWSANNDFHAQATEAWDGDWAQDSLLLAERVLHKLSVPAPAWLNNTYYQKRIVLMDQPSQQLSAPLLI